MEKINIEGRECFVHCSGHPEVILLQLTARHEHKHLQAELQEIEHKAKRGFLFVGINLDAWTTCLMPWADEAVIRDNEKPEADSTLQYIISCLLPWLNGSYGQLPCILGGYSLGGLFALWAATKEERFYGVAAASPSVWIKGWLTYSASNHLLCRQAYLSLGDREEHVRNQRMAAVGTCIREYLLTAKKQIGEVQVTMEWNKGGHFDDEPQRMARAFIWNINRL